MMTISCLVSLREMKHTGLKQLQLGLVVVKQHRGHSPCFCPLHRCFAIFHLKKNTSEFKCHPSSLTTLQEHLVARTKLFYKTGRRSK